jgi:hypothetical protein
MPGMALALSIFGVAFVAFFVWLTLRLINRGWRSVRRLWIVALPVAMLAYPLSLFPVSWLETRNVFWDVPFADSAIAIYRAPLYWLADNGPEWFEFTVDFLDTSAVPLE